MGLSIPIVIMSLGFAWLMWQIFLTGRTRWTLDDNGLNMTWTKQFAFCNNPGIGIPWNKIKKISKGLDPMVTGDDFVVLIAAINEKHHLT